MTTVVVTGATGNVGRHVVSELRRRGIPHRAFTRDPERATAVLGPGADLVQGDFADPASLRAAFAGAEQAFLSCANDPRQVGNAANAIEAAATAGVRQIVMLSTVGAEAGAAETFADQHGRIEHRLRSAGIPFVILRSSFLMSNLLGSLPTIGQAGRIFLPADDARVAMIDPRDVAACAVAVLSGQSRDGETHLITGPEALTFTEVAHRLSSALGRTVEYVAVPDEAALAGMLGAGLPPWLAEGVVGIFQLLREGTNADTTDSVRQLTGHDPRPVADFARDLMAPLQ
ncbi:MULTISPECIES: SDR family oxidoreductase [unclassified Streptomyces]|uniref:SDR family oxidoreductase n=1 Tax=unclassified Streptomyces TaxID=2593676 RepID=UPI002254BA44|nr:MULTISPECIES: SDR family oxidoreductase [unclassified Streptomyces]MCX5123526.1 SDR family oxidoreductase [Streptomyces sp. NBC_00347]MCX5405619.1 SDR family oxidoreductase [Streptomyces sp. NBC_00086]